MKRVAKYFFEGLMIMVPIVASVYIVYILFTRIDGILKIPIPGVGFLVTVAVITLIGFLASNLVTRKIFELVEKVFTKLPLVKLLYSSVKDLIGAFVGDKKSFDKPVLVTLIPGSGTRALGFITRDSLEFLGLSGHVAVYFPQSYNFAGNLLIFPSGQVEPLPIDSSDAMAFLVSGGVSGGIPKKRWRSGVTKSGI